MPAVTKLSSNPLILSVYTIYRFCCLFTRSVSYSEGSHASLLGLLWPLFILADGLPLFYTFSFSFSFSLFINQEKSIKNQQVLFKCGESAKVLCQCPLELLLFGNILLNSALNIWRFCLIIWAIMETFQGGPVHSVAFLSYLSCDGINNQRPWNVWNNVKKLSQFFLLLTNLTGSKSNWLQGSEVLEV